MKKILLATTALVMTAGYAAAEVNLSGYAEMGVKSTDGDQSFHQDLDVTFKLSSETDEGLSFGATIDLDEVNASAEVGGSGSTTLSSVYVSGSFGKLTLGDTDGAFDYAMAESAGLTALTDENTGHIGFSGNSGLDGQHDGQVLRYELSMGDVTVVASMEQAADGVSSQADNTSGVGLKYSTDAAGTAITLGVGYQTGTANATAGTVAVATSTNVDVIGASVTLANGPITFIANTSSFDYNANAINGSTASVMYDKTYSGVSLTYAVSDATSVNVNWGQVDYNTTTTDQNSTGVTLNHDLGGGAVVMAGYASDTSATSGDQDSWSIGLGMSF
jgi:outer membrane protein OmpU